MTPLGPVGTSLLISGGLHQARRGCSSEIGQQGEMGGCGRPAERPWDQESAFSAQSRDKWDPWLLSPRLPGAKIYGQVGTKHCQGVSLASGNWESLDSATAFRPAAENGRCLPSVASWVLVPVRDGKAEDFSVPLLPHL